MTLEIRDEDEVLAWARIGVLGEGAADYLQGQLTQDITSLSVEGAWSLILEPDGVALSSAWVRGREGGFDLDVPAGLASTVLARLRRFRLRARCEIELDGEGATPLGSLGDQVDALWPGEGEFAAHLAPQSFGAGVVDACVSFTKGCYTGQELVARLDARAGNVPWRLVRVRASDVETIDAVLRSSGPEGPRGVTLAIARDGGVVALGIAHRSLLAEASLGLVLETSN